MARARSFDPRRLDVEAFAAAAGTLEGELAQSTLERLGAAVLPWPGDSAAAPVLWRASGERRAVTGGAPETWLHLQASTTVRLECQRCLQPMAEPLAVDRRFRFVADEDQAAVLDEASEDDVLVASHSFDLAALIEDELILALPLVPRHPACPEPLPVTPDAGADEAAPNPFAALAALRRPGSE